MTNQTQWCGCPNIDGCETTPAQDSLASAIPNSDFSDNYSNVYNRSPELQQAIKQTGETAFSDSDKRELAQDASSADTSRLYMPCVTDEIQEAADALNLDDTPRTVNEW